MILPIFYTFNDFWDDIFGIHELWGVNMGFWVGIALVIILIIVLMITFWFFPKKKEKPKKEKKTKATKEK
ncbi:MAG: hypothetical protein LUD22_03805 [Coprobacillus sp.]|nr:hypothetical protein [Coprobacillus sp.]